MGKVTNLSISYHQIIPADLIHILTHWQKLQFLKFLTKSFIFIDLLSSLTSKMIHELWVIGMTRTTGKWNKPFVFLPNFRFCYNAWYLFHLDYFPTNCAYHRHFNIVRLEWWLPVFKQFYFCNLQLKLLEYCHMYL